MRSHFKVRAWEALPLCRAGSGRSEGRGKEGASQQFRGSETALQGGQMGEQVLHLPSTNSVQQSCHQTLKGAIRAAAQPISGHCFGAFPLPPSQQSAQPGRVLCSQLGDLVSCCSWGTPGALWDRSWLPALSGGKSAGFGAGALPQLWGVGFPPDF